MKNNIPTVSIVMPLFNKEKEVSRAIQSVLSQTVQDFELIVIDDGSKDKGPQIVAAIDDLRIKKFNQENVGVSSARNRGIREAKADLIAFLDADDEWESDFLETILRMRDIFPFCKVFATAYCFSSPDGHRRNIILKGIPKSPWEGILKDYFIIAAKSDPPLCSSAVAVSKEAFISIGGFPDGITSGEDLLTWARLAAKYDIAYCNVPKASFWMPNSVSDRPGRLPQIPDKVGAGLQCLIEETDFPRIRGIKNYLALWHRMRGIIYIQIGDRKSALYEFFKALKYTATLKLYLFIIVTLIPSNLSYNILITLKRVKRSFFQLHS